VLMSWSTALRPSEASAEASSYLRSEVWGRIAVGPLVLGSVPRLGWRGRGRRRWVSESTAFEREDR
jgi:hypothetical protein